MRMIWRVEGGKGGTDSGFLDGCEEAFEVSVLDVNPEPLR